MSDNKESKRADQAQVTNPPLTPFQAIWGEYVHRVKVHELLRCLEVEQKKLRILRENLNFRDIKAVKSVEESRDATDMENRVVFHRPLEEEEKSSELIADEIRLNKAEPRYVSKSVIRLFESNQSMTNEQFERILELCKDDQERKQLQEAYQEKRAREKYLHNASEDRRMLYNFLNSSPMQMFMLVIIFLSTIVLFMLSFERVNNFYSYGLIVLDSIIMAVFMVEAGLKMYIYKDDYFRSPANCLDLTIIVTHFIEILIDLITDTLGMSVDLSSQPFFKFLKSLRALRVLRAIKFLPNLEVIISTIIQSLMSISSIAALMLLFMFVFAVVGRELFREDDEKRFGNFVKTSLTLFQLLTLDDWGDILEDQDDDKRIVMFIYLFLYIVCEYFVFLNLFVAVLVDNFQMSIEAAQTVVDADEEEHKWNERLEELLEGKSHDMDALHSRHKAPSNELTIHDYMKVGKSSREATLLADNLKKLAAIDFQYFVWNRRMRLTSIVLEAATAERGINVGQANVEIPPVDKIEPGPPDPSEMPLKPKRVPKKPDDMLESNFQLKAKEHKKKRRRSTIKAEKSTQKLKAKEGKDKKNPKQGKDEGKTKKPKETEDKEKADGKKKNAKQK